MSRIVIVVRTLEFELYGKFQRKTRGPKTE
jgi:hypothetical protein